MSLENNNEIAAAEALTTALEKQPDHPRVLGNQSRLLTRKGDLDNATEILKTALKNLDNIELGKPLSTEIDDSNQQNTEFTAETYIAVGNAALELHQW
ncbi:MAG: hypothetical protein GWO10_13950, partial [candidate division Zixibacteria bacterium]|nr:hypothetical protein [candidate division Zixibacteria bacterium]